MATTIVTPDPETISMDELRKLAEAEAVKASTPVIEAAPAEAPIEVKEVQPVPPPQTYFSERTIDLGDGSGVQVFKGRGDSREASLEDCLDKLADAQKHATQKIHELSKAKPVERTYTKDEESLYSAELLSTPTIAFKKLFRDVTGVDVEEFKTVTAREKAFQEAQGKKAQADVFMAAHPDYYDTVRNGKLVGKWLELHNDFSSESFEKAYQDLSTSGLLDVKGEEASVEQKEPERIVQEISSPRTKKSSGLSTHRTAVPVVPATTEEDMYALPMEELRKRADAQMRGL